MKIKTITCHHVYNYGATLQAFALQNYLERLGHDVEIIDYRLLSHTRYELFKLNALSKTYRLTSAFPFVRYFIAPYKNRKMLKTWGRKKAFDLFDKQFLNISKQTYRKYAEIVASPPNADLFIAGSDQIWNPNLPNGTDRGYYLDFGDETARRVAYAASFGVNELTPSEANFIKQQLKKFQYISVREESGLSILKNLGIKATKCLDPVFLLRKEEWIKQLNLHEGKDNYIMLYDFAHDDQRMQKFVLSLAKREGLDIVSVNDYSHATYANRQINDAGPKEFLQWLMNARYVIANSFHATAFSLIFHKPFVSFPLSRQKNSSRMTDMLANVGLSKHFAPIENTWDIGAINWNNVDEKLGKDIENSKMFLLHSCNLGSNE